MPVPSKAPQGRLASAWSRERTNTIRKMHPSHRIDRRSFCEAGLLWLSARALYSQSVVDAYQLIAQTDRSRILRAATTYVDLPPATITSFRSRRSPGGVHDFFSE